MPRLLFSLLFAALACAAPLGAQDAVRWLTFEQLEDSLAVRPKPVFIDFYTDWCSYCRKMDKVVFTKPAVVDRLNTGYYAVRFDAESRDTVRFGGRVLVNDQVGQSRTPLHQITQILALRGDRFTAPTLVILNEEFRVVARHFRYLDGKGVLGVLGE